jgi:hypothetical protein
MTSLGTSLTPRARVAVLRSLDEAERVADLLRDRDLDALVETDDALTAMPGQSLLPGVLPGAGGLFAYPVTVPLAEQGRARAVLGTAPARRQALSTTTLARGAVLALLAAGLVAAVRIALS